jgi:hypothetical protein
VEGLLRLELLGVLDHEVQDDGLFLLREEDSPELGGSEHFLPRCPDILRRLAKSPDPVVHDRSQGEKLEVVGLPVLVPEVRLEQICLQRGEPATESADRHLTHANGRARTARTRADGRGAGPAAARER